MYHWHCDWNQMTAFYFKAYFIVEAYFAVSFQTLRMIETIKTFKTIKTIKRLRRNILMSEIYLVLNARCIKQSSWVNSYSIGQEYKGYVQVEIIASDMTGKELLTAFIRFPQVDHSDLILSCHGIKERVEIYPGIQLINIIG